MTRPSYRTGLFTVSTCHGSTLRYAVESGRLFHGRGAAAGPSLFLYIPSGAPHAAFLLPSVAGALALRLASEPPVAVLPLRLQRTVGSGRVALCHCFTGRFLCAMPPPPGSEDGVLAIDRTECGLWESFDLLEAPVAQLSPAAADWVRALDRWSGQPVTGPNVYTLIENGVEVRDAPALDAFCRLLPHDQLVWLGPTILGRPSALERLGHTFADDLFASTALLDLNRWLAERPKLPRGRLPVELDALSTIGLDGQYISFPHICNAFARRNVPARFPVCILATARNEGLYLLEWLAHHRSIGVNGFFIYSNDNDDGSDRLLEALAAAGVITWISSDVRVGGSAQPKAYGHALGVLPDILDFRWTLIIDLDEFFVLDSARFSSVTDYIAWQEGQPVDSVAFNWVVFGSCGENSWRDAPLTTRFTRSLPWLDPHVKTMTRTSLMMQSRPHHPCVDTRQAMVTRNASGQVHVAGSSPSFSARPEASAAWVNHYFLKSAEEFLWKFSRNRGDHALVHGHNLASVDGEFLEMFVSQHQSPGVTPDLRIQANGPAMQQELATLTALPGVAEAMAEIKAGFGRTISHLKAGLAGMPRFRVPGSSQAQLASFLGL